MTSDLKIFTPCPPQWSFLVFGVIFLLLAWMESAERDRIDPDRFLPQVFKSLTPEQQERILEEAKKGPSAWLVESFGPTSPRSVAARQEMEGLLVKIYFYLIVSVLCLGVSGYLFWRRGKQASPERQSSDFPP